MVDKEELLEERYLLLQDKNNISRSIQCLYYVYDSGSSFNRLENSRLYIKTIQELIDTRIKEIDKLLNL